MGSCDVCSATTSWGEGAAYTADEFRTLVARGFEPDSSVISMTMMKTGLSGAMALATWKTRLVALSTSGWLLCPSCARRAAQYLPKPAGTGPAGHVLSEPIRPEMMRPVTAAEAGTPVLDVSSSGGPGPEAAPNPRRREARLPWPRRLRRATPPMGQVPLWRLGPGRADR